MQATELRGLVATAAVVCAAAAGGAYSPSARLGIGLVSAILLAWLVVRGDRLEKADWIGLALLIWAGICAAGRGEAILESKILIGTWLIAWAVLQCCRRMAGAGKKAGLVMVAGGTMALALAVLLEAVGAAGMVDQRPGGLFVNPNVTAALIVAAIPAVWLLPKSWRMLAISTAVLGGGALLASGSRAAILAFGAAAICALRSWKSRLICGLIVVIAASALIGWRLSAQPDSLAWHRPAIWRALSELVAQRPITGLGPGGLADATGPVRIPSPGRLAQHQKRIGSAESTLISIVTRLGVVGGLIVLALSVSWSSRAHRAGTFGHPARRATIAAIFTICLFHDVLEDGIVLWWWAVLTGLIESETEAQSPAKAISGLRLASAAAGLGIVACAVMQPAWAARIWWSGPSTPDLAEQTFRAERWYVEPVRWRVRNLLSEPSWDLRLAGEAMHWSQVMVSTDPGKAGLWADFARVHRRIATELGAWPDSLEMVRLGFSRACQLEPHLPWIWLEAASFERSLGNLETAARFAQRAVKEEPVFVRGWLLLARIEIDLGNMDRAIHCLATAEAARRRRFEAATSYEHLLVLAPDWQLAQLRAILAASEHAQQQSSTALRTGGLRNAPLGSVIRSSKSNSG